jgi:hypothetical protein
MRCLFVFILIIYNLSFSYFNVEAQEVKTERDRFILLTMPFNQRQLTLYRGQTQLNAGYKFAVRTQSFTSDGKLIYLKSNGTGSVYHYYFIDFRYGLTNFIEIGAETNFLRRGIRDETVNVTSITPTSTESVTVNKLIESKGMGDMFIFTTIRLPIEYKWFDFDITGGLFVPSSKYEPRKPSNTVVSDIAASNTYTVNLHYNYTNGYGVPVYLLGATGKIGYKKFSALADFSFRTPVKEGKNIRWEETLTDKLFSYYDKSYSYLLSDTYTLDVSLHYQATGWFNLSLNSNFFHTKGGWTEYWGNKYENQIKRLINLEPGFELQVSPSLTVYQTAGFPLKGKNSDAPFYLFTTLSFNMFPFLR